jgi:hypothetical protein
MGFLDHSTNNIIIDAVLTNVGRELLASNAGVFNIDKFSLSDDEIDYGIIKKFGRTVGKEKIIKNTPIFEAQTGADIAQKYRCMSIMDPSVTHLPILRATAVTAPGGTTLPSGGTVQDAVTSEYTSFQIVKGQSGANVKCQQVMATAGQDFPPGLQDMFFDVYVNNIFIKAQTGSYNSLDPLSSIARYAVSGLSAGQVEVLIKARDMGDEQFNTHHDPDDPQRITTVISIVGRNSGSRVDMTVVIKKTA